MAKSNQGTVKFKLFSMIASMFMTSGTDERTSSKRAYHQVFMEGGNPEFSPAKHTVFGYAAQNRAAKKRRKVRAKKCK